MAVRNQVPRHRLERPAWRRSAPRGAKRRQAGRSKRWRGTWFRTAISWGVCGLLVSCSSTGPRYYVGETTLESTFERLEESGPLAVVGRTKVFSHQDTLEEAKRFATISEASIQEIERIFGPLKSPVLRLYVVPGLRSDAYSDEQYAAAKLTYIGLATWRQRDATVVLTPRCQAEEFVHELCHLRMTELESPLSDHLEEGVAHAVETAQESCWNTGYAKDVLNGHVASSYEAMLNATEPLDIGRSRRTAWALIFTLINRDGLSLAEIAQFVDADFRSRVIVADALEFVLAEIERRDDLP